MEIAHRPTNVNKIICIHLLKMCFLGGLYLTDLDDSWADGKLRFTAFNPRKNHAIPISIDPVRGVNKLAYDF